MTEATAVDTRKHARDCVRRASGLVLTRHSEKGLYRRAAGIGNAKRCSILRTRVTGVPQRPIVQTAEMAKNKRERTPKTVLQLPEIGPSKSAVPNSLTSLSSQRS